MTRLLAAATIVLSLSLMMAVPVAAKDRGSLPESVRKAERQGSVLSAEPVQQDGRQVNRVKVLTNDGRVRVMEMDAEPRRDNKSSSPPRGNQGQTASNNKAEGDPEPL
jgi:hypothetical protein